MASVTLDTLWLNDAGDLADAMSFPRMSKLVADRPARGEVRTYAGGRTRLVTRRGRHHRHRVELPQCTREQVQWLSDHAGQLVLVRDPQGRRYWGVYFEAPADELGFIDEADVQLELVEVSHDEAV